MNYLAPIPRNALSTLVSGNVPQQGGFTPEGWERAKNIMYGGAEAGVNTLPGAGFVQSYNAANAAIEAARHGQYLEALQQGANALISPVGEVAQILSPYAAPAIFIGRKGISALGKSRALEKAEEAFNAAKKAGASEKELEALDRKLWKETGFTFRFPDEMPRGEISDEGMKINYSALENYDDALGYGGGKGRFSDLASHDELRKAYPSDFTAGTDESLVLNPKTYLGIFPGQPGRGEYSPGTGIRAESSTKEGLRGTTLHELQHAVQEREGFAGGGSPRVSSWASMKQRPELVQAAQQIMEEWKPATYKQFWGDEITEEGQKAYSQYLKHWNSKEGKAERWRAAQEGAPRKVYDMLAGEAEARLTANRMNYTPAHRAAKYPLDEMDVPREMQIVRREGGLAASDNSEEPATLGMLYRLLEEQQPKVGLGEIREFYRAGKLPEGGRSYNHRDKFYEKGTSVYWHPYATSFAGLKGADWYKGKGRLIGFGSDDEPVIEPIGKWTKFFDKKKDAEEFGNATYKFYKMMKTK